MKKIYLSKVIVALMLGFFGLVNASAQDVNPQKVNIVEVPAFEGDGRDTPSFLAESSGEIIFKEAQDATSRWYKIAANQVFIPEWIVAGYQNWEAQSEEGNYMPTYYYKNVNSGKYLYADEEVLAKLVGGRDGDWAPNGCVPSIADANGKTLPFQWFEVPAQWGWGIYFFNAAEMDFEATKPSNFAFAIGSITMMNSSGGFGGLDRGQVQLGQYSNSNGNAWCAVKKVVVVTEGVDNPDYDPGSGINEVGANKGIVSYANGALRVIGYPASASLTIYNVLGGTAADYKQVSELMNVNLASGIYLIKVQAEGKTFAHKVLVK